MTVCKTKKEHVDAQDSALEDIDRQQKLAAVAAVVDAYRETGARGESVVGKIAIRAIWEILKGHD